ETDTNIIRSKRNLKSTFLKRKASNPLKQVDNHNIDIILVQGFKDDKFKQMEFSYEDYISIDRVKLKLLNSIRALKTKGCKSIILKPTEGAGSIGVVQIQEPDNDKDIKEKIEWHLEEIESINFIGPKMTMIQEYIPGIEIGGQGW